ncbi:MULTISPECIES: zinc-binding alcohol dehydrogenase family protein [Saccharibacillus]|uniref:zinc-binding alcohol dehydrogenase family protein n=1 Tax=Saccharibacillus TaxID=456492 RepID=UPI00123C18E4|nr:zinc-binding alcohol dehydrogenase family protein [Saccharibacillus sp. WB 17]MWJ30498.1 alcohol dehydrogenase catalytic domain-containing protein [Saccharibacillus sp. WB 17]
MTRGVVCEEIGRLVWREDLPEPAPAPGHAIVRIRRIGICGTDLHAYRGRQPFFDYPRILGHELAGVIEEVGDNSEGLRAGDQVSLIPYRHCGRCGACRSGKTNCCRQMQVFGVHTDGGMRERVSMPVSHLIRTEGLTLDQSAMLEPLAIGAHGIRRAGVQAGDTVLVIGAGPIGLGVMVLARHAGANVIAMDLSAERLEFCRSWAGVEQTLTASGDSLAQLEALTDGELVPIVIDATGSAESMQQAFRFVSHGGTLVYVGLVKGQIAFDDPHFHSRELTLSASRNATRQDFDFVLDAMAAGVIDADRYITHRAPLEEAAERFESWLRPESKVIKAMVEIGD